MAGILTYIKAPKIIARNYVNMEWKQIAAAPFERDLQLAVIDYDGTHALVFPCRRILDAVVECERSSMAIRVEQAQLAAPAVHVTLLSV